MARLLVVDDDETYREELSFILTTRGHEVRAVSQGREAIGQGTTFRPQIAIVDWGLAGEMNGVQVAEALRERISDLRIIMITGYAADDLLRLITIPVSQVLEKPFGMDQLFGAVDRALAGAEKPT